MSVALPQADAGRDQVVEVGATVTLDGSASAHLHGTLAYGWALIAAPAGSTAALDAPADPQPRFVADLAGVYIAQLIVFDGAQLSPADTVVVSTGANLAPRADLGPNQLVTIGVPVLLDALATDPNDDALTFTWALLGRPAGSAASCRRCRVRRCTLIPDLPGDYVVQLIATDPGGLASVDTRLLTTGNTRPAVDAGVDRHVATGAAVSLEAVVSNPSGGTVSYDWRVLSGPAGADLDNPTTDTPTFTADEDGVYVVQVIVRDENNLVAIDAIVIRATAGGNLPPIADAGDPQTVPTGTVVQLDGTGSIDPESAPLAYLWQIVSKPAGSSAALSNPAAPQPTVLIDVAGEYVFDLVVHDGTQPSAPDQVTVTGIAPVTLSLTPKTSSIASGGSTLLTVTASSMVSSNLQVNLSSSNVALLGVPPTVTILAGQMSANFNANAGPGSGGAIVTASAAGAGNAKATVAVGARLVAWTDDTSGNWSDATKWTDDIAPGPGDVVVIDRPAGTFVITVNGPTAAVQTLYAAEHLEVPSSLTISGHGAVDGGLSLSGLLNGVGSVTLGGPATWTSGTINLEGGFEVAAARTLTIATGNDHGLVNTTLRNHGTVQWTGGRLLHQAGNITVINEADGIWNVAGADLQMALTGQPFNNAGQLHKTGAGQLVLAATFTNTGTIDVDAGEVLMASGQLFHSGVVDMAAGTTLNANLMTFGTGTTLAGTGTITMPGVTTVTVTNLNLTLPAVLTSLVQGVGKVTVNAPFTWTSGTINLEGGFEVAAARTLTIATGNDHGLVNTTLRNHGTVQWTGGRLLHQAGNITVINEADGIWNVAGADLQMALTGQPFNNAGQLHKTGAGQLVLAATFTNTGTIDVDAGEVLMASGQLFHSGVVDMAAGTTLNANLMTFGTGTTLAGTGTITMPGVTTVTATNLNLTLPAVLTSLVQGVGKVTVNAPFTWTSGTINAGGRIRGGDSPDVDDRDGERSRAGQHDAAESRHGAMDGWPAAAPGGQHHGDQRSGRDLECGGGGPADGAHRPAVQQRRAAAQDGRGPTGARRDVHEHGDDRRGRGRSAHGERSTVPQRRGRHGGGDDAERESDDVWDRDDVGGDGDDHDAGSDDGDGDESEPDAAGGADLAGAGRREGHGECAVHVDERHDRSGGRIRGGGSPDVDDRDGERSRAGQHDAAESRHGAVDGWPAAVSGGEQHGDQRSGRDLERRCRNLRYRRRRRSGVHQPRAPERGRCRDDHTQRQPGDLVHGGDHGGHHDRALIRRKIGAAT